MAHDRGFTVDEVAANEMLKETADYVGARKGRADVSRADILPAGKMAELMSAWTPAPSEAHYPKTLEPTRGSGYLKSRQSEDGKMDRSRAHRPASGIEFNHRLDCRDNSKPNRGLRSARQRAEYAKEAVTRRAVVDMEPRRGTADEAALRILTDYFMRTLRLRRIVKAKISLAGRRHRDGWSQLPML